MKHIQHERNASRPLEEESLLGDERQERAQNLSRIRELIRTTREENLLPGRHEAALECLLQIVRCANAVHNGSADEDTKALLSAAEQTHAILHEFGYKLRGDLIDIEPRIAWINLEARNVEEGALRGEDAAMLRRCRAAFAEDRDGTPAAWIYNRDYEEARRVSGAMRSAVYRYSSWVSKVRQKFASSSLRCDGAAAISDHDLQEEIFSLLGDTCGLIQGMDQEAFPCRAALIDTLARVERAGFARRSSDRRYVRCEVCDDFEAIERDLVSRQIRPPLFGEPYSALLDSSAIRSSVLELPPVRDWDPNLQGLKLYQYQHPFLPPPEGFWERVCEVERQWVVDGADKKANKGLEREFTAEDMKYVFEREGAKVIYAELDGRFVMFDMVLTLKAGMAPQTLERFEVLRKIGYSPESPAWAYLIFCDNDGLSKAKQRGVDVNMWVHQAIGDACAVEGMTELWMKYRTNNPTAHAHHRVGFRDTPLRCVEGENGQYSFTAAYLPLVESPYFHQNI